MKNNLKQFLEIKNFFSKKKCKKIRDEIKDFDTYDDLVMSGKKINNLKFYKNINKKLGTIEDKKNKWSTDLRKIFFSKSIYGAQTGKK